MSLQEFGYQEQLRRVLNTKDLVICGMIFMVPIAPRGIRVRLERRQGHGPAGVLAGTFRNVLHRAELRNGDWMRHLVCPLTGLGVITLRAV
jgi:hypothetical protein